MEASSENWVTIQQRQTNISKEITHWQTWTESMNLDKIKLRSEQKKNLFFFKRCVLRPELKTLNVYTLWGKSIREFQRVDPEKKKHLPNFSCLMFGTERRAKQTEHRQTLVVRRQQLERLCQSKAMQTTVTHYGDVVINASSNWQAVELVEEVCSILKTWWTGSFWSLWSFFIRNGDKQRVAVI